MSQLKFSEIMWKSRLPISETVHFSKSELLKLFSEFRRISNKNAVLDIKGFRQCLGVLGWVEDSFLCQRLFEVFNKSKTGFISFEEYATGLGVLMKGSVDEKLDFAFMLTDMDNSGEITLKELELTIESIMRIYAGVLGGGPVRTGPFSQEKIKKVFKQLDQDGDGHISNEEYKAGLKEHPDLIKLLRGSQRVESMEAVKLRRVLKVTKCYRRLCAGLEVGLKQAIFLAEQLKDPDSQLHAATLSSPNSAVSIGSFTSSSKDYQTCDSPASLNASSSNGTSNGGHPPLDTYSQLLCSLKEIQQTLLCMSADDFPKNVTPRLRPLIQKQNRMEKSLSMTETLPEKDLQPGLAKNCSDFEAELLYSSEENENSQYYTSDQNEGKEIEAREDDAVDLPTSETTSSTKTVRMVEAEIPTKTEAGVTGNDSGKEKRKRTRRERKLRNYLAVSNKSGSTVFFGHKNWNLVVNVMKGIHMAVSRAAAEPLRPISIFDFSVKEKYTLISQRTKVSKKRWKKDADLDTKSCRFVDYAPYVFKRLRDSFGLKNEEYIESIGPSNMISNLMLGSLSSLSEQGSEGKSGSFFYITPDGKYLIKTIHREEHKLFRHILPEYFHHMTAVDASGMAAPATDSTSPSTTKRTLLTWILGCHVIRLSKRNKFKAEKIYLVVMNNILNTELKLGYRFDLKGSRTGRRHSEQERKEHKKTLKDLDFLDLDFKINIGSEKKQVLMDCLRRDCHFLEKRGLIDYSLLLGIHKITATGDSEERRLVREHKSVDSATVLIAESGKEIYFLGVLDFLTPYSTRKCAEQMIKTVQYWDPDGISVQPPQKYAKRFLGFMEKIIS